MIATFAPQGPSASRIANLLWVMMALAAVVYFVFLAVLLVGLRSRRKPGRDEPVRDEPETKALSDRKEGRWLAVGGVFIPTLVLSIVFVFTVRSMNQTPQEAPKGSLVVNLVGHRWWWEVNYPSAGVSTANEIHIPVGKPVAIRMTSADVIHSFWVPELSGKMDAFPDYANELVLEANNEGSFQGSCAEFCGLHHARMPIVVVVHSEGGFAAWLNKESLSSRAPSSGSEAAGKEVFRNAGCANCHTVREGVARAVSPSTSSEKRSLGPDLSHQADRGKLISMRRERTRQVLAQWITNPTSIKPESGMPATALKPRDLKSLLDYLESLK